MADICVLGAGAWGSALAMAQAANQTEVLLWARRPEQAAKIAKTRTASPYLTSDLTLPKNVQVTADLSETKFAKFLIVVTPAQVTREILRSLAPTGNIILCCKGIERTTGLLMPQMAKEILPEANIFVLSGPNFAVEVASGLPAAATLAAEHLANAVHLAQELATPSLRLYPSADLKGVALGGALKNVIAIAAGAVDGAGLGENARATITTRGLAEIARIASAMGAERETLMGLAGLGDLMLTCSSYRSRNYSLGVELGKGRTLNDILSERSGVSEGVETAQAGLALAAQHGVEAPIISAVSHVLSGQLSLQKAVASLMSRPSPTTELG
jgi:glycerol-3-phosphate dehydrogenase (NAD(P)+)